MSVRFLIGRAGTGKTTKCLMEITESLRADPHGEPIIFIVPDQMTFLSEYELITSPHLKGMMRAQVYSFTRLAWRILQETGGGSRAHLSNTGINMLIRKIIEEKKDELTVFQQASDKSGFIDQVEQMITEFRRYCIPPSELNNQQQILSDVGTETQQGLQDKLHDLELIYRQFEEEIVGKYLDSEDYFQLLAEKIPQSKQLQTAHIYIDGFHSFTPQEYLIISQLMKYCPRVTITLTLDQRAISSVLDELDLFRMTGETYQTLMDIVKKEQIALEGTDVFMRQRRAAVPSLEHLESHFDQNMPKRYQQEANITIYEAANRRAEVEGVARKITEWIQTHGYRYRDIAVLMRNGSEYHDLIQAIFDDYRIPYFIDQNQTMLHHPLIEFIRSTLEIIHGNWRYEAVFRAIKTELLFPLQANQQKMRENMDQLENYVLAYGIQGNKWTQTDRWIYRRYRGLELETIVQTDKEKELEFQLNEWRLLITAPIVRLSRRLKRAQTGRMMCEAIFLFLEELHIQEKLENWQLAEEAKGNLVKRNEHRQAWNNVIELLDQYVEILGDEKLPVKQFANVLDAGLESLKFSLVPPAMDQVLIADLEMSRLLNIRAAFVIGLNEGVLPTKIVDEGILADADRTRLESAGLRLAPTSRIKLLDEAFVAYKAFTTPSDHLVVSYPIADEEGKALMPSFYIERLQEQFPRAKKEQLFIDPTDCSEKEQLAYVVNENRALSYLTAQLQRKKRNYPMFDFWWDVYNYYMNHDQWRTIVGKVLTSLFYENRATPLSDKTTIDLYGEEITGSVSRMEMYQRCPFAHFAGHGLKLRERQIYRLEAPDIGELFHGALKYIADTINEKNLSWSTLTVSQCQQLAMESVKSLAPKLQNEILFSSHRQHYMKRKLTNVVSRATTILSEHARKSTFTPIGIEVAFGPKGSLPPLQFTLKNGTKMSLIGRIDRIDKAEDEHGVYLRVVDYKSSKRKVDLTEIYYGLALQMLTYLDIAITNSKLYIGVEATPAGVLYFHVHNPIVKAEKPLTAEEAERAVFKEFKMNGLMLADENVIRLMDQSLDTGYSQIVPARINKTGLSMKQSSVAELEQIETMRHYVRHLFATTGNEIVEGTTAIAPYKLKNKTGCTFCPFKEVCQFDPSLVGSQYRILEPLDQAEAISRMEREVHNDEETGNSTET